VPRGDRTGPAGLGAMIGRAAGYGAGRHGSAYLNLAPCLGLWSWIRRRGRGRAKGRGGGRGAGKGRGLGRGTGRGRGMMPSSWPAPPHQIGEEEVLAPTTPTPPPSRSGNDQDLQELKAQARATVQELRATNEKNTQVQVGGHLPSSVVAAVDATQCTGCGACAAICPMEAIAVDATASIETSRCAGCGLCVDECPQAAITLKRT
jgi:ferredoxin